MTSRHAHVSGAEPRATTPSTRLRGRSLFAARAVWIIASTLVVGLLVANIPVAYERYLAVCVGDECELRLSSEEAATLRELRLSVGFWASYLVVVQTVYAVGYCAIGAVLFRKKSNDWLVWLVSLTLVLLSCNDLDPLPQAYHGWWLPVQSVYLLGLVALFLPFSLFPDGRFVPRWMSWVAIAWILYKVPYYLFPGSPLSGQTWPGPFDASLTLGMLGCLIVAQIYRYLRVSGPVERQQTKWVLFGLTVPIATLTVTVCVGLTFSGLIEKGVPRMIYQLISIAALSITSLLIPLTIAISVLKYRLWDIDVILNRALVYSTLSAVLAAVYAITNTLLLPLLVEAILGEEYSSLNAVVSAVIIAVLFEPLRRRIQAGVDRLSDWLAGGEGTSEFLSPPSDR